MKENQEKKYADYKKRFWIIYALICIVLMAILVLVVAGDNEERFFFGLMTPAAFYVFRPTERYISKLILKHTGVSKPAEED